MPQDRLDAAVTLPGEDFSRVALTAEAVELLRKLWLQHGPLMFHQSGGCCDGSSPMCYPAGEFITGDSDVLLGLFNLSFAGTSGGVSSDPAGSPGRGRPLEFWMSREQFGYWSHTHLTGGCGSGPGQRILGGIARGEALPDPVHPDGLAGLNRAPNQRERTLGALRQEGPKCTFARPGGPQVYVRAPRAVSRYGTTGTVQSVDSSVHKSVSIPYQDCGSPYEPPPDQINRAVNGRRR